jgi:hypothetical protein
MDIVFFVYGLPFVMLPFVTMGLAILLQRMII